MNDIKRIAKVAVTELLLAEYEDVQVTIKVFGDLGPEEITIVSGNIRSESDDGIV